MGIVARRKTNVFCLKESLFLLPRTERSESGDPGFALMELQLIQSKADIENPQTVIEAKVC